MPTLSTRSTSRETMEMDPIVLRETTTTRLTFYPCWVSSSSNPLRGGFKFERKSPLDTWEAFDSKPLSSLKKDEAYILPLKGDEISSLLFNLENIKEILEKYGHSYGERNIIFSEKNAENVLLQIGEIDNRDLVIQQLKKLEENNFKNISSLVDITKLDKIIEEFEKNLNNSDESFWQNFFEDKDGVWVLQQIFSFPVLFLQGEAYVGGKNTKGRQGRGGVATDYLFKNHSNDSFAVVEIKTPKTKLVKNYLYRGDFEGETNCIHELEKDLYGGVIQLENQIHTAIDKFKDELGEDFKELNMIDPCGVLLIGNKEDLNISQKKTFNLFRKTLGKNLIYTFDELLFKIKQFRTFYNEN